MPQDVIIMAQAAIDQGSKNPQPAGLIRLRVQAAERLLPGLFA